MLKQVFVCNFSGDMVWTLLLSRIPKGTKRKTHEVRRR